MGGRGLNKIANGKGTQEFTWEPVLFHTTSRLPSITPLQSLVMRNGPLAVPQPGTPERALVSPIHLTSGSHSLIAVSAPTATPSLHSSLYLFLPDLLEQLLTGLICSFIHSTDTTRQPPCMCQASLISRGLPPSRHHRDLSKE